MSEKEKASEVFERAVAATAQEFPELLKQYLKLKKREVALKELQAWQNYHRDILAMRLGYY